MQTGCQTSVASWHISHNTDAYILWNSSLLIATCCLDVDTCCRLPGFHLTRRQLNVLPDPEEAYARRGAPWTFNAGAFLQALLQLRNDGKT